MLSENEIRKLVGRIISNLSVEADNASAKVVAIGSDHRGYKIKEALVPFIKDWGWQVINTGCYSEQSVDYPDVAAAVAKEIQSGHASYGVLIDGAGIGSSIVANKFKGIRAAFCFNEATILNSKKHNDANILTLGEPFHSSDEIKSLVKIWLETTFEGGRHQARIDKITKIEYNI